MLRRGMGRGKGRGRRGGRGLRRFLEPVLLLRLHEGTAHGYSLLDGMDEFGLAGLDPSMLYRVLREMEDLGWVSSTWDERQTQGPPRRIYTLSPLGDEVLAEWKEEAESLTFHVYCHVSGGLVFGRASWRESIFRNEMPLVLEAIRYGDKRVFAGDARLDRAEILGHFQRSKVDVEKVEQWGRFYGYV